MIGAAVDATEAIAELRKELEAARKVIETARRAIRNDALVGEVLRCQEALAAYDARKNP